MDQEKFEQHLMDYLFDELDEVTAAAMKRKLDSDAACRELEAGLRATIEVAQLPVEEPDDDLEERILVAANIAQRGEPWHRKLLRSLSWAGSHAMRPQLAMAAILMLVIGSSILLLRARPGSVAVTPTKEAPPPATEEPAERPPPPEPLAAAEEEAEEDADASEAPEAAPAEPSATAVAAAELEEIYERALDQHRAGKHAEAQQQFAIVAGSASPKAPSAALYVAETTRAVSGCGQAASKYQTVINDYPGTAVASDAAWQLADCYWQLGQEARARTLWRSLLESKAYADRAARELNVRGEAASTGGSAVASKRRAAAPDEKAAPPPKAKPQKPAREADKASAVEEPAAEPAPNAY